MEIMVTYAHALKQILGLLVNVELAAVRVLGEVESRDLRNVLILALTLLLLQLEGNTTDGTTLDALHQVRGVAGNLWYNVRANSRSRFEHMLTLLRRRLEAMMAISSQILYGK